MDSLDDRVVSIGQQAFPIRELETNIEPTRFQEIELAPEAKPEAISPREQKESYSTKIKKHLAMATGGLVVAALSPYIAFDTQVMNMGHLESMDVRMKNLTLGYLFLSGAYMYGRSVFKNLLKLKETSTGFEKRMVDAGYGGLFTGALTTITHATGTGEINSEDFLPYVLAGTFIGIGMGWTADAFKELFGAGYSPRVPPKIRALPKRLNIGIASLATAASLSFSSWLYNNLPDQVVTKEYSPNTTAAY